MTDYHSLYSDHFTLSIGFVLRGQTPARHGCWCMQFQIARLNVFALPLDAQADRSHHRAMVRPAGKGVRGFTLRIVKFPVIAIGVVGLIVLEFAGWACAVASPVAALMTLGVLVDYMGGGLDGTGLLITLAVSVPVMAGGALFLHYRDPQ